MRAERLTDLINNRITAAHREASVTIHFFDPVTQDRMQVARRIKQNPQGYTSTYILNGRNSSLTEIHERLAKHHVSPGCYNVMMQGDVAGIVNMPAGERRKILDEMAGVAEFDRKIELAEKELFTAKDTIEKQGLLMLEFKERLFQLEKEKEKALRYKTLRDERHATETRLMILKVRLWESVIKQAEIQIAQLQEEKQADKASLQALDTQRTQVQAQLATLAQTLQRQGEQELLDLKSKMMGIEMQSKRAEHQLQTLGQERTSLKNTLHQLDLQVQGLMQWVASHQDTETTYLQEKQGLEAEAQAAQEALEAFSTRWEEAQKAQQAKNAERDALQVDIREQQQLVNKLEQELMSIEGKLSLLDAKHAQANERVTTLQTQAHHLEARLTRIEDEHTDTLALIQETEERIASCKGRMQRLEQELQALQQTFQEHREKLAQAETQKRVIEEMTFQRAVEVVLKESPEGVHGTIAQLCSVMDAEHLTALEIALGGRVQNLVVDHDGVAQRCIELLKRRGAGRATFLPLNKIKSYPIPNSLPHGAGVIDFAINLLAFDPCYDTVFSFALGDTLIVDTLEDGRRLLGKYRMVTLDGSLLEKSGAMTGGGQAPHRHGQRALLQVGLTPSQSLKDVAQEDSLGVLKQQMFDLQESIRKRQEHFKKETQTLDVLRHEHQALTQKLSRFQTATEELQTQHQALLAEMVSLQSEQPSANIEASQVSQDAQVRQVLLSDKQTLEETHDVEARHLENLLAELASFDMAQPGDGTQESQQFQQLSRQLQHLQKQLTQLEKHYEQTKAEMQRKQDALARMKQDQLKALERLSIMDTEESEQRQVMAQSQTELHQLSIQQRALEAELNSLHQERQTLQEALLTLERQRAEHERTQQRRDEAILAWQARRREAEQGLTDGLTHLEEEGLSATAPEPHPAFGEPMPEQALLDSLAKWLTDAARRLQAMEPVNMLALEEYDVLQARYTEMQTKLETLAEEREALLSRIEHQESLKKVSFMKAFEFVNEAFVTIFAELSDGIGRLILTNPDDPLRSGLTIEAQPRGKKMQRLESMSGGEKSLTSLAFVFALQRYAPAPFYALDEVDMNLDGVNAEKLARMVRREAHKAQFLVVSLRKPMLEVSDQTIGVTQRRDGYTKVTGLRGVSDLLPASGNHEGLTNETTPPAAIPSELSLEAPALTLSS
jgi:chromosome segregation protein